MANLKSRNRYLKAIKTSFPEIIRKYWCKSGIHFHHYYRTKFSFEKLAKQPVSISYAVYPRGFPKGDVLRRIIEYCDPKEWTCKY